MERVLIFTGSTDEQIFRIWGRIETLNRTGEISLGENVMLRKDRDGKVTAKTVAGERFLFLSMGVLREGLLGLICGPLGTIIATSLGSLMDVNDKMLTRDVRSDYLEQLLTAIPKGSFACVVQLEESQPGLMDSLLKEKDLSVRSLDVELHMEVVIQNRIVSIEKGIDRLSDRLKVEDPEVRRELSEEIWKLLSWKEELEEALHLRIRKQYEQCSNWRKKLEAEIYGKGEMPTPSEGERLAFLLKRMADLEKMQHKNADSQDWC